MKTVPIRIRLLAMLALPVAALTVVAGMNVRRAGNQLDMARRQHEQAEITAGPASLVGALQDERNYAAVWMIGLEAGADLRAKDNPSARATTDELLSEFRRRLEATEPEVQQTYRGALTSTEEMIGQIRDSVDSTTGRGKGQITKADGVFSDYSDLIDLFHDANDRSLELIADTDLRSMGRSLAFQTRTADLQAQIFRDIAVPKITQDSGDPIGFGERVEIAKKRANFDYFQQRSIDLLAGTPSTQKVVYGWINRPMQKEFSQHLKEFLESGTGTGLTVVLNAAADESHPNSFDAGDATVQAMQARSNELIAAAEADRTWNLILLAVTIAGSLGGAFMVARGLIRPIQRLTEEALVMAGETLPASVASVLDTPTGTDIAMPEMTSMPASTVTEVAELATALNSVQASALNLAVEQAGLRHNSADSLVNLGRRVQGLVGRQLEVLSDLESSEPELERLNELYRADHLATRVRRNAESLIVLAGSAKVQRRTSFGPPVAVEGVVRSAVTEVEQFDRIVLGDLGTSEVSGQVAKDLAHLLAELLENGLAFSPPTTDVAVSGRLLSDGRYVIRIDDSGIGLRPEPLKEANSRLSGEETFNTTPSKYLGHYVIGHLAKTHGITVELSSNDDEGVTARVVVPAALVSAPQPAPVPAPVPAPAPATDVSPIQDDSPAQSISSVQTMEINDVDLIPAPPSQANDDHRTLKPWDISVASADTMHDTDIDTAAEGTYASYVHANRTLHELVSARREIDAEVRAPV